MNNNSFIKDTNFPKLGAPNFDSMRPDKTKIPLPPERSRQIVNFYTALKMMERFRYRQWMGLSDVIGPNGERINSDGEVYTPRFRRKTNNAN